MLSLDYHTHKKKKANLKFHSNNTAVLVAPLQSVLSLPNYPSGKNTTMQTLRLIHNRLDLRLIGVSGGAIVK